VLSTPPCRDRKQHGPNEVRIRIQSRPSPPRVTDQSGLGRGELITLLGSDSERDEGTDLVMAMLVAREPRWEVALRVAPGPVVSLLGVVGVFAFAGMGPLATSSRVSTKPTMRTP
jgi:hypothetical protein